MNTTKIIRAPDKTEKFWQLVEQAHGEVIAFGLSRLLSSIEKIDTKTNKKKNNQAHWGISYITSRGFYFHHFPQNNFFSNILGGSKEQEYTFFIDFAQLKEWKTIEQHKKSFFNLFTRDELILVMRGLASYAVFTQTTSLSSSEVETKPGIIINEVCDHYLFLDLQGQDLIRALHQEVANLYIKEDH